MSKIHTRYKVADKKREDQFYLVANTQLFHSSEHTEVSPMSTTAVSIAAVFHSFIRIIEHNDLTTAILAHSHRYHE